MFTSSDHFEAAAIADLALQHGIKNVIASPGSRNAPLNIAFEKKEGVDVKVIHDERSAAFFALGMAQQLNVPVILICTSGSAAQNYAPAVSEAYYQGIPLVAITADRPTIWAGQGVGQTIRQKNIFEPNVWHSLHLFESDDQATHQANVRLINETFLEARKGPVHLNVSFKEPLYGTKEYLAPFRKIEKLEPSRSLDNDQKFYFQKKWNDHKKILILVGLYPFDPRLNRVLSELAEDPSCAVVVENTSNLYHPKFSHCIDRLITTFTPEEKEALMPDLIITMGGAVISKKIKTMFRNADIKEHWHIEPADKKEIKDTFQKLTHIIHHYPADFFNDLLPGMVIDRDERFGLHWKQRDYQVQAKHEEFLIQAPFSDLKVFSFIQDVLPEGSQLQMGNSSVVRYCQLFDPIQTIRYHANRGTSGIDGSTSTAVGAAWVKNEVWCTLITGDVAFLYDSNALWNQYLPSNLRIFLINNGGGGIFRIIDGPNTSEHLEKSFEAHHNQTAEHLAKAFNIHYYQAHTEEDLDTQIADFYTAKEDQRPCIMEVFTPRLKNAQVLKDYFEFLKG